MRNMIERLLAKFFPPKLFKIKTVEEFERWLRFEAKPNWMDPFQQRDYSRAENKQVATVPVSPKPQPVTISELSCIFPPQPTIFPPKLVMPGYLR